MTTSSSTDIGTVVWVMDKPGLKMLTQYAIPTSDVITFDLETTGLDEHAVANGLSNAGVPARIVLVSFTLDHDDRLTNYVVPLSHPDSPLLGQWRKVSRILAQRMRGKKLVGHHVKFDVRWLYAMTGVDLAPDIHWDTMLSASLLDENSPAKLKEVAPKVFGIERWDDFSLSSPGAAERVNLFQLGEYAAADTYWTRRLYDHHHNLLVGAWEETPPAFPEEIDLARLGQLAQRVTMPTSRTLAAMEQRGLALDTDWVREQLEELQTAHRGAFDELASRYVGEQVPGDSGATLAPEDASFAPTSLWFRAWAEIAVEKGDLRVTSLTPNGKPQWSKSVLSRQARKGSEVAAKLLTLRDAAKKAEFLRSWLEKVSPDGKIHSTYNVGTVVTGRLSSSYPNLQQVTRALRPAFVPSEGYYLAELDFSQIELRVAAFISRCEPMIEAYRQESDLHLMIAGQSNVEKAVQAAELFLLWLGLPANGTGAEVLRRVRGSQGGGVLRTKVSEVIRAASSDGTDQESGRRERWCAERGVESPVEGWGESAGVSAVSEGLLRELRGHYERLGWPWDWVTDDAGRPSHQPRQDGQQTLELDYAVQVVSSADASTLTQLTGEDWKHMRQLGKALNFGLIYGMGVTGFREYAEDAYGVILTDKEAERVHTAFFDLWTGLREWHLDTGMVLAREGQVISPIGRIRRLYELHRSDEFRGVRAAVNSPVQGFASDIMQIAAALIEQDSPNTGARLVGTVHDSILVEVPIDSWRVAIDACIRAMESDVLTVLEELGCVFDVPLVADATCGTRWGVTDVQS